MPLAPGSRIGPYEILAPLGAGGMGEVYRALDPVLHREVAIKVLPPSFAEDPERLARFTREAQTLAALNHPNIAHIHGMEEHALVMELVEGDDLSVPILRGPMPLADVLPIARQIASALEAAHEQGIVHRDLKPANVKVRADGVVKVLDFGLAKATDTPGTRRHSDMANSPTITTRGTELGVILGTAAYMAPEQARGKAVDRRADIWAFGAVLFEMLTGRKAFDGDEVTDVLAAVLRQDVDWNALPLDTPPRLRRLLERCLDRDVTERLRDIGEARVEIAKIQSGAPETVSMPVATLSPRRSGWRERLLWLGAGGLLVGAAVVIGSIVAASKIDSLGAEPRTVRLPFLPPEDVIEDEGLIAYAAISPDGSKLVFTGRPAAGRQQLWLRPLDAMEARPLAGSEDAIEPFWSPDGRSIAFGAAGKLKGLDLAGGQPQTLADAPRLGGGAWGRDGVILFCPDIRGGLLRVAAAGGAVSEVVPAETAGGGIGINRPVFLPDGRHFLYTVSASGGVAKIMAGALNAKETKVLVPDGGTAAFAAPDWLLYLRNGALVARKLDPDKVALDGEPMPVATGTSGDATMAGGRFSVSDDGTLIVQRGRIYDYQLTWFDRAGNRVGTAGPASKVTNVQSPVLSDDRRRVALQRTDPQTRNQDIWAIDLERDTLQRLTTDPAYDQLPVWAPDGATLFFAGSRNGVGGIYRMSASGGDEQLLLAGSVYPMDVSPDGRYLIYTQRGEKTRQDIWALPLAGERKPTPLVRSEFDDRQPQVSPDGRFLAYVSDVTGTAEVYVRPFRVDGGSAEATAVSSGGGVSPRWRRDGKELFYIAAPASMADGRLMAVAVKEGSASLELGGAVALIRTHMVPNATAAEYDVSADGQRFLVGTVLGDRRQAPLGIVLHWAAELNR